MLVFALPCCANVPSPLKESVYTSVLATPFPVIPAHLVLCALAHTNSPSGAPFSFFRGRRIRTERIKGQARRKGDNICRASAEFKAYDEPYLV